MAIAILATLMFSGAEAAAATRNVSLQWDPVSDARVHHYELHYGTAAGRYGSILTTTTSSASVSLPQDGKTYYFAARACDERATNCSAFSNELSVNGSAGGGDGAPDANFTASVLSGTAPLTVAFADQTTGAVTSRGWSFGDGVTSQASTAVHTYIVPGTYTVALTVTGANGKDTETRSGYITVNPLQNKPPVTEKIPSPGIDTPGPGVKELDAIEVGDIKINHQWQRINFKHRFNDPIVITGGLSYLGLDPAMIRVRDVDSDGFWVRIHEWDYLDGWHTMENASYIVLERGRYSLPGGILVEADSITTDVTAAYQFQELSAGFEKAPIVLASINSMNGAQAATYRVRDISKNGFFVGMWEQELSDQWHVPERIDYIAWQASSGEIGGVRFEAGVADNTITNASATLSYDSESATKPSFLAAMQTTNGTDPAAMRITSVTKTSAKLFVEEERSRDAETNHVPEKIGYFLAEPAH